MTLQQNISWFAASFDRIERREIHGKAGSEAGGATVGQPATRLLGGIDNPVDAPLRSDRLPR